MVSDSKFIPRTGKVARAHTDESRVTIHFSPDEFPTQRFFNRFSLSEIDGGLLMDFGLVDRSGLLIQAFSAVFNEDSLRRFRPNLADYFGNNANVHGAFDKLVNSPWQPAPSAREAVYSVDFLGLSMQEFAGDVDLYYIPIRKVTTFMAEKSGSGHVPANPVAALRSPLAVHKLLIKELLIRSETS
jgi:hypothetical protein